MRKWGKLARGVKAKRRTTNGHKTGAEVSMDYCNC